VAGQAPLVESELGICGGLAAVPFPDEYKDWFVADPSGATCVFSIKPTTARYALDYEANALYRGSDRFAFGDCLWIYNDGEMVRNAYAYAVPPGWVTGCYPHPKFTRFECWRVTL
jgi:hypothetical protein